MGIKKGHHKFAWPFLNLEPDYLDNVTFLEIN